MNIRTSFPSLVALADRAEHTAARENSRTNSDDFSGCSFDKAVSFARHGWPEGAAKAKRLLDRLQLPVPHAVHSETYHDVTGSYVDVGEYVQGVPECMVDFRADRRPVRFAHLIVSATFSAAIETQAVIQRGATIAAVVDALETQGIRCTVDLLFQSTDYTARIIGATPSTFEVRVPIKEAHAPLNLDTLTFGVAHPAYLRRLMFAVMEQYPADVRDHYQVGFGYGISRPIKDVPGSIIFQTPGEKESWSEADSLARIQAVLADTLGRVS